MTLQEIVDQLKKCGYECEGGRLENNIAFRELEAMCRPELASPLKGGEVTREKVEIFK